jgi:hypothetical protein
VIIRLRCGGHEGGDRGGRHENTCRSRFRIDRWPRCVSIPVYAAGQTAGGADKEADSVCCLVFAPGMQCR